MVIDDTMSGIVTQEIVSRSESDTAAIGREIAARLRAGDVVLLFGDLGAGKTALTKGLAEGLGVSQDAVSSPTFTIMQEYRGGRLPLFHVDLYRLNDPREIEDLGLDEIASAGVLAIEWAEKLPPRLKLALSSIDDLARAIEIHLTHRDGDQRCVTVA